MTDPIIVPPIVAHTVRAALAERDRRRGLPGFNRVAALTAAELAVSPITTSDVVHQVAAWHQAHPEDTSVDGRSTALAGVWGGRAGRDWAFDMLTRLAALPAFVDEPATSDGPAAAGIAIVARDTGRCLMLQRAIIEGDDDPAAGKWEFPGGKIDDGEGVLEAARREFAEEVGIPPVGTLAGDWTSPNGVYHGLVYLVDRETDVDVNLNADDRHVLNPDDPDGDHIEVVAWWDPADADGNPVIRQEARDGTPWGQLADVARARQAALRASGEWHNSDGWSRDATAEQMARHLMLDHPNVPDDRDGLPGDVDELDQLHLEDHEMFGEVGAHVASIGPPEMLPILSGNPGRRQKRRKLRSASKRLARVDQQLRTKLHAGAEVAVADGLRRAGVKVTQRAAKRSKTAQAVVAGCGGAYTPTVLAAAGITEQEALDHALDGFAVSAAAWMATARRDRIRILVDELDITAEEAAALDDEYAGAESRSIDFLVAGLAALALARLANPAVPDTGRGETIDGHVPAGLVYDALAIADGRAAVGPGNDGVGTLDAGEWDVDRFGGGITLGAISDAAGGDVVEQLTWIWGGSGRPFDPHLELDGSTTTADAMETDWANTEGWPDAPFYFPGDHYGCNCEWVSEFVTGGDGEGDDAGGDGE